LPPWQAANGNQLVTAIVSNSSTSNWDLIMDENKAPSGIPQAASNPTDPAAAPPSGHPPAGEPIESKSELASIDSPTLAPSMAEMSGAKSGRDAPKIERPSVVRNRKT